MQSKEYYISPKEVGFRATTDSAASDGLLEKINAYLLDRGPVDKLRRGDTVALFTRAERFRNEGVFVWNGQRVVDLDFSIDEYGSIPSDFRVSDTEFSPAYWRQTIRFNGYFHLSPEILRRFQFKAVVKEEDVVIYATVQIGKEVWTAYLDSLEEWDDGSSGAGTMERFKEHLLNGHMLFSTTPFESSYRKKENCFYLKRNVARLGERKYISV